ncbi:MAG: hypothetical protein JWM84_2771 [Nocardioides sp.]|nr:hypothetical protein [Nocardioides sp.]
MSRTLHFLRGHAAVLLAVLLVTGSGAAFGLAQTTGTGGDQSRAAGSGTIYACVKVKTKAMTETTKAKRCPQGSKKISWNVAGRAGAPGPAGVPGGPGPSGAPGADGQDGQDFSGTSAYVYSTLPQLVAIEADVIFENSLAAQGVTHVPGTGAITVLTSGRYAVRFVVSANEPNQFALTRNGMVVPGSTYGSGAGTQQNSGEVLVDLEAGDVLTLRNHTSVVAVTLPTLAGGVQPNVNASLIIEKVGPPA